MEDRKSIIPFGIIWGLFIVAYFPAMQILVSQWTEREDYSHAFLMAPIIGYIVWLKREELHKQQNNFQKIVATIILTLSTMLYLLASKFHFLSAINASMVISLFALLLYCLDFRSIKKLAFPILLTIMLIPIPLQFYSAITVPLQLRVSELSGFLVRLLNVPLLREGNVLFIPNKTFEVIDACSGMRYIISIATLSLLLGYFTLNKTLSKIILVAFAIPVAFLVNTIRVVTLILAFHYFQIDLSTGTVHTFTGVVIFGIAILTLFLLQRILEFWEQRQIKKYSI